MKKFIALGAALAVLLFNFIPTVSVAEVNQGVMVCEDIRPNPNPND